MVKRPALFKYHTYSETNMALHFALPSTIHFDIGQETVPINAFDAKEEKQNLGQQPVNIIASGPSIAEQAISKLQSTPTIFVNGSLSLTADCDFKSVVGYVISDARFIHHRPEVLQRYYKGQSLYATVAVFEAIAATQPEMLWRYRDAMRIIYLVDRPWGVKSNKASHTKLSSKYQWLSQRKSLADFADNPNFVITDRRTSTPIGVSLDVSYGFVEAGTVAYVATQLAFTRRAGAIHLYGIDLLNSNQPRFYEDSRDSAPTKLGEVTKVHIVPSFNLLGSVYKEHGVPVINHSPISKNLFDTLG